MMECRRRWAVDDDRSQRKWAADEDRRRIKWAVDLDRHHRSWVVDDDRRRRRWAVDDDQRRRRWAVDDERRRRSWEVNDYPPLELPLKWRDPPPEYPPLELPLKWRDPPPEYPPLELPLKWRNPLPDHRVRNQSAAIARDTPSLHPHSVTHSFTATFSCDPIPLPQVPPEPMDSLRSLTPPCPSAPRLLPHDLSLPLPPPCSSSMRHIPSNPSPPLSQTIVIPPKSSLISPARTELLLPLPPCSHNLDSGVKFKLLRTTSASSCDRPADLSVLQATAPNSLSSLYAPVIDAFHHPTQFSLPNPATSDDVNMDDKFAPQTPVQSVNPLFRARAPEFSFPHAPASDQISRSNLPACLESSITASSDSLDPESTSDEIRPQVVPVLVAHSTPFPLSAPLPHIVPMDLPMVLLNPQEACPTAEVYKQLHIGKTSSVDPLMLLEKCFQGGISQDGFINDLQPPAFDVLPSLKRLKQHLLAVERGQYSVVFMCGSGSSIIGIGSTDPPQFVYDEDEYNDIFISEASFLTVCDDLLVFSIAEMNINDVEMCGKATGCGTGNIFTVGVKIPGLNSFNKIDLEQCPQAVRHNVNEEAGPKFVQPYTNKKLQLDWKTRYNIVEGISQGLVYLHHNSRLRIIHCDLEASNILLDENMSPKISDSGMERIFGSDANETKRVIGTYDCMTLEYAMSSLFIVKSDVYGFGVLLIEIISGIRHSTYYNSEVSLTQPARICMEVVEQGQCNGEGRFIYKEFKLNMGSIKMAS